MAISHSIDSKWHQFNVANSFADIVYQTHGILGSDVSIVLFATIRAGMSCYKTKGTTQSKCHRQSLDIRY